MLEYLQNANHFCRQIFTEFLLLQVHISSHHNNHWHCYNACSTKIKMAAARMRTALLKNTIFSGLKSIPCTRYSFNSKPPHMNAWQCFKNYRFISAKSYLAKDRKDRVDDEYEKQHKDEKRTDLRRLKELLFQKNFKAEKNDKDSHNAVDLVKPRGKQKKSKAKAKPKAAVNLTRMTDMLSTLKPSERYSSGTREKSEVRVVEKVAQAAEAGMDRMLDFTRSVEADKFRDALATLEQDNSTADEVIMANRQISSDARSSIEGAYNIKQRQLRDKDKRKKMARSSLKSGARFHMFDKVREKWPRENDDVDKTIFQEMSEQEVKELGMSTTVQSGFHDLMDNINYQWSFPVDNEICKTEDGVGFDEHVFLEHHLDDFPKTGNIRQFMELVVTGLQQNPHLSVEEKKEHIEWFREYFQNMPDEQVQL